MQKTEGKLQLSTGTPIIYSTAPGSVDGAGGGIRCRCRLCVCRSNTAGAHRIEVWLSSAFP